jgi:hypothetical protein
MTLQQVQGVTGHKSARISSIYTHLDARQIADVTKAQEVIAGIKNAKPKKQPEETAENKKEPKGLEIVKNFEMKTA